MAEATDWEEFRYALQYGNGDGLHEAHLGSPDMRV
jgi:hypothetical protein